MVDDALVIDKFEEQATQLDLEEFVVIHLLFGSIVSCYVEFKIKGLHVWEDLWYPNYHMTNVLNVKNVSTF